MPNVQGSTLRCAAQGAINLNLIKGEYKQVGRTINDIKFAIHEYGTVILGFRITSEWNLVDSKTGKISISNNPSSLGGHCVLGVGFDDEGLYIQNSWAESWGIYGFAILPWKLFNVQIMDACIIVPETYQFEHQK
jgi:C1A family cysteine protease